MAAFVIVSLAPSAEGQFVSVPIGELNYWGDVFAINESGQVVGYRSSTSSRFYHAFSWTQRGGMIDLAPLGIPPDYDSDEWVATARAVNDRGQVVGISILADRSWHAFTWTQAEGMIDLGTLGGTSSDALAVNDRGQVVGTSTLADGSSHAFSWTQEGGMVDLGTLGGPRSAAAAVNEAGQVVGTSTLADGASHAFSWTHAGGMIDLGTLGGGYAQAVAVNASGQVAGASSLADGSRRAFLWTQEDGMTDLGTCGQSSYASALNDAGQVVGGCHGVPSALHLAFSWTKQGGLIDLSDGGYFGDRTGATAVNESGQIAGVLGYGGVLWKTDPMAEIRLLAGMVQDIGLPFGTGTSLRAKLAAVSASLAAGDSATACDPLASFMSEVNALDGKKIASADAEDLIVSAGDILTMLRCPY